MKRKATFYSAAFVLLTSLASAAFSAENVSIKIYTLGNISFTDLKTNQVSSFAPIVSGNLDKGTLSGYADVTLPEGIYLVRGQQHMPAELGTVCQIVDRVVVVKSVADPKAPQSRAFGTITNALGKANFKDECWDDFGAIGQVPHYHNR